MANAFSRLRRAALAATSEWGGAKTKAAGDPVIDWRREPGWRSLEGMLGLSGFGGHIGLSEALRISAFMACLDVIAQDIAKTPIHMYRRTQRGRSRVFRHPVAKMLAQGPNDRQSRSEFFSQLVFNLKLWGDGYILIEETLAQPTALHVAPSARVTLHVTPSDTLAYWIAPAGDVERIMLKEAPWRLPERRVIHLRQRSLDGLCGLGGLNIGQRALGISEMLTQYRERLYGNAAAMNGVFSHGDDKKISEEAFQRLKRDLREEHAAFKAGRIPLVLDGGLKYDVQDMNADRAQVKDALQRELSDAARLFRVPPHKIAALENVQYNNIEPMERAYVYDTLDPTMVDIELAFAAKLLSDEERGDYFFEFDRDRLQVIDMKTRIEKACQLFESGLASRNEARERVGMNPEAQDLRVIRGNQAVVLDDGSVVYPGQAKEEADG